MGWAFCALPAFRGALCSALGGAAAQQGRARAQGRYLVNGSARGLVQIELTPPQRARMLGMPIELRELSVSVAEPHALVAALRG